jgi:hypothetical protein
MVDHGAWQELAVPGASLLARCLGRGRLLVDPISALTVDLLMRGVSDQLEDLLIECSKDELRLVLGQLMRLAERVSDDLDRRTIL